MTAIRDEALPIYVGTSAWSYDDWKGTFYPEHLRPGERLAFYSQHFSTVEVDSTFYHAPDRHVTAHWAEATPANFKFSLKLTREITHEHRLRDCEALLERFVSGCEPLGKKLACVLVQLPPSMEPKHDEHALRDFIRVLPKSVRFAVEFRQAGWHVPRVVHLLEQHDICWVWNDTSSQDTAREAAFGSWPVCTDFLYVRLLGELDSKYGKDGSLLHRYQKLMWPRDEGINNWIERIRGAHPTPPNIFVYAANHYEGFAPHSAARFLRRCGLNGRLPDAAELKGGDSQQLTLL